MAVPTITLTSAGWVLPAESDILAGVLADMNTAFGGNLNLNLETPQGQLATTFTAIIGSKNSEELALYNGFDPLYSSGRQQDALGRIYFLDRDPARSTSVSVTLTGLSGTVIPLGALAQATDGNLYSNTGAVTISSGGSVTATFAANTTGPIACPAGSLNRIYQAVPGWDTITNPTDGSIGNDVESAQAYEARRAASVALNARSILDSIQANVLAVANVLDAYTTENATGNSVTVGGFTLAPNSLYVAVSGGTDADVAQAIWEKKAPGCSYNGNTTVTVTDTNAGYTTPPSYTVTFERPTDTPIKFAVRIANSASVPSDYGAQIANAIIAAFAGLDGGSRARIGSTLYALRYYDAVRALGAWAQVLSIQIGIGTANADSVQVGIAQRPVVSSGDITSTAV